MSAVTSTMPTTPSNCHRRHSSHPGFSTLFNSVLGSPFLTTGDLPELVDGALIAVPHAHTITRPPSPTPTVDSSTFSFVQYDASASTPNRTPLKNILPRLWDSVFPPPSNSYTYSYGSQKARRRYMDHSIDYSELEPLDGEEGELITVDDEACFFIDSHYGSRAVTGIDIIALLPPELALHIFEQLTSSLPVILTCGLVSHTWRELTTDNTVWRALFLARWNVDLARQRSRPSTLLPRTDESCRNLPATMKFPQQVVGQPKKKRKTKQLFPTKDPFTSPSTSPFPVRAAGPRRFFTPPPTTPPSRHILPPALARRSFSASSVQDIAPPLQMQPKRLENAPLQLDWYALYRTRLELDRRWRGTALMPRPTPKPTLASPESGDQASQARLAGQRPRVRTSYGQYPKPPRMVSYEPQILSISGHKDSVYCLEFDSKRIFTGSRDRTIKVWSVKDGRLLGNFNTPPEVVDGDVRGHTGSVLCLKFSSDWDLSEDEDRQDGERNQGFMVSGSSDCTVCVWNLWTGSRVGKAGDREVKGEVKSVLRGHEGGVLDLRIDDHWIVSCSKDAVIRVWDRDSLQVVRTLRGHEGPVNSIGIQNGRVVSASGDGKMILWDIASGERIRTFEGHDRGLACIEFKGDYIISGSTGCCIKKWSAVTGDLISSFVGHDALVRALSFDPNSGLLVSASYDKTVKLWDFATGKLIREFKGTHSSHIFDVKFDVSRIVSASHDHKIVIIDFSKGLDTTLFV
ncbi:hypothetical protein H0H87_002141 [Tephrocybe sp. NHM501043]|nr:hypothetical protein H0H87_002141 [Tephrocybe sp. NHM501043]